MKLYREVKASERLPIIDAWYYVKFNYEIPNEKMKGTHSWHPFSSEIPDQYSRFVEYWLEPIEITEKMLCNMVNRNLVIDEHNGDEYPCLTPKGAKAIIEYLKNERK
jgi:hypothetical protein